MYHYGRVLTNGRGGRGRYKVFRVKGLGRIEYRGVTGVLVGKTGATVVRLGMWRYIGEL
jgi:hypothetical protein